MMRTLTLMTATLLTGIFSCSSGFLLAESPVDRTSPLSEVKTDFDLADGPAWDGGGALYVPDVKGRKLYRYVPRKNLWQVVLKETSALSASFYNHGRLYLSDNAGANLAVLEGTKLRTLIQHDPKAKPPLRPNDLVVDGRGGIYYTLTARNEVRYLSPDGKDSVAVVEIETPNGLILSPDEKTLYVAAYVPKQIFAYSVNDAVVTAPGKLFAEMDKGPERGADGMAIDRAGNVYCAGPKHIWIWNPAGNLLDKIETPTRPINCAFGDSNMETLYITCFSGVYAQKMNVFGKPPQPPATKELQPARSSRPATTIPESVTARLDVVYAQYGDRKLLADLFVPKGKTGPLPAVVVVHGGGWLKGDKTKFRALAVALAEKGYVTAAIEYRLGGEARFPAGIHDCNAAVRFLRANAKEYQIDPARIGAVGGSAGGHLVGLMASGFAIKELQGKGGHADQSSKLQAAIVMAGPMEMTTGSVAERSRTQGAKSNSNRWLGKTIDEAPELYKLADAHVHLSKMTPPLLFMVGEHDNPARNQPSREKLKALGVWSDVKIYKAGKHGCWNQTPWFTEMVGDMDAFFSQHLKTDS